MSCAACQAAIERTVGKMDGVQSAVVNLLANTLTTEYDETKVTNEAICSRIAQIGYGATPEGAAPEAKTSQEKKAAEEAATRWRALVWSTIISVILMVLSMGSMQGWLPESLSGTRGAVPVTLTLFILASIVLLIQRHFYINGFRSLFNGHPNMDALVAIGSSTAYLFGLVSLYLMAFASADGNTEEVRRLFGNLYLDSAAMVPTLVSVGKYMESRAKSKATEAVTALAKLRPSIATVIRNGAEVTVPIDSVQVGDLLAVKAGETIPADGRVKTGLAWVDESVVTGESLPVEKTPGKEVTGASVAKSGHLTVEVTRVGKDSTLSRIIALVEEATSTKAPIARLADKVAAIFVPIVIGIALVTLIVWLVLGKDLSFAVTMAISVLVIACPCSLGLATPTAIMVGTGRAARLGILVKDAKSLELMGRVKTMLLDKTGTLTQARPVITDLIPSDNSDRNELLQLASSIEKLSEHPLGRPIIERAADVGLATLPLTDFMQVPGAGIRATANGELLLAGNARLMSELGPGLSEKENALSEKLSLEGKTVLWFSLGKRILGAIALQDPLKPDAKEAMAALHEAGLRLVMLTGDQELTARAIARQAGIDEVRAGLKPEDKARILEEFRKGGNLVAMVGDGINDAPALAAADVGIAIGTGTDVALGSADIVLSQNRLTGLADARRLSQAVIRNIHQNLFWAFIYNTLGIPIAAGLFYPFGIILNPMVSAAAMSLSSVCVVTNALRLRFFKSAFQNSESTAAPKAAASEAIPAEPKACPVLEPETPEERNSTEMADTKTLNLAVTGMSCKHCQAHVKEALEKVPGVASAEVDLEGAKACVKADDSVTADALVKAVEAAGYGASPLEGKTVTLPVKGMMCGHCQARVKKALEGVAGVTSADVDLEGAKATVACGTGVSEDALKKAIVDAGYEVA
ncbi:cadmium-translocating P-type ATPase [Sutterella sp. AF15-45LB]|nr:cadmium-translocating P-type ATPase [Sutterella sp. AF15-45LB]RGU79410.1 cadmium-translocating P-type ATPase [Sutterella sp. AF15-44LB]RHH07612.1 cadmium-translocating P-type ATPase [Sutterella sp. AM18-8-1]